VSLAGPRGRPAHGPRLPVSARPSERAGAGLRFSGLGDG
jgi:hypothetical protein